MLETDQIPAGKCPNCGYIAGGTLIYRFPNPSECVECNAEVTNTTLATPETVDRLKAEGPK